jgi:hypothetical protein
MSTKYNYGKDVPLSVLCDRLDFLSDCVTKGKDVINRNFSMRVPAEVDYDADLILSEASRRLRELKIFRDSRTTRKNLTQELIDWIDFNKKAREPLYNVAMRLMKVR